MSGKDRVKEYRLRCRAWKGCEVLSRASSASAVAIGDEICWIHSVEVLQDVSQTDHIVFAIVRISFLWSVLHVVGSVSFNCIVEQTLEVDRDVLVPFALALELQITSLSTACFKKMAVRTLNPVSTIFLCLRPRTGFLNFFFAASLTSAFSFSRFWRLADLTCVFLMAILGREAAVAAVVRRQEQCQLARSRCYLDGNRGWQRTHR